MKKVIILGHFWPYRDGGSKRVLGLAKYLPQFGWQPTILTGKLKTKPDPRFKIIETPSTNAIVEFKKRLGLNPQKSLQEQIGISPIKREKHNSWVKKLIKVVEGAVTYPDIEKGWQPFAYQAIKQLLKKEATDALISIWPLTSHLIAKTIKDQYQIPWIADFPDLWSYTCAYRYGRFRKLLDVRLEKRILKSADMLTTSSAPLAETLKNLHHRKAQPIMIGYDPETVNQTTKLTKKFTITYTGVVYSPTERNPEKLFRALSDLIALNLINPDDVEVKFYGPPAEWIQRLIKKYRLSAIIKQNGVIPWTECLQKQRQSQILLHLNWEEVGEKGVFSGKLPEYLAARRPILAAGGVNQDEVVKAILSQTKAGVYCPWVKDIKKQILRFYSEYKHKGYIPYQADLQKVNQYSYEKMAKKFAKILDLVSKKNSLTNLCP